MSIVESLQQRRTHYLINDDLPVSNEEVVACIQELVELVPDAFDMKSSRVMIVFGDRSKQLWDTIYEVFEGMVPREKIDGFAAGRGTVLFFYDTATVENMQAQFPDYADNFPGWALQASGMLQLSVWSGLRELHIGASLQHYNPVIDEAVRTLLGVPDTYRLISQMPFGGIIEEPKPKEREDISLRVTIAG